MAARPHSFVTLAVLVVLAVVGAGVGAGVLHHFDTAPAANGPRTVVVGDNVTVNYIGIMGSGPQEGRVFDTSNQSVAQNNTSYPKTLEFTYRANGSNYTPLGVYVGPSAPSGGYNLSGLTFVSVVTGFWRGLLGMSVNETRALTMPPSLAYGPANASCERTGNLNTTLPVVTYLAPANFTKAYPKATAVAGTTFVDPTYDWTDYVASVNSSSVAVVYEPPLGAVASPNGWPMEVSAKTSSTITLSSELTAVNAGHVLGNGTAKVCGESKFIVSAVNVQAGTYTQDYNPEVAGATLIFVVTLVAFY
jgi:FKBP-type peptidyl-prolyl cis-trans isomerase 2